MTQLAIEKAVALVDGDFPLIVRAAAGARMLESDTCKWNPYPQDGEREWLNFAQIFRTPFTMSTTMQATERYGGHSFEKIKTEMLKQHLEDIERTLLEGRLSKQTYFGIDEDGELYSYEVKTMGGAKFYLQRDVVDTDTLDLGILRDTEYRDLTSIDIDGHRGEWLSEISLFVAP